MYTAFIPHVYIMYIACLYHVYLFADMCVAFVVAVQPRCGAVQHRWRTGQCRTAAGSYSALGVAVHHRWRTGQGRILAAHSSQNSELGGTACCSETLVFGCFGCVMFFLGREERVQIPDTQPWSPQSVNTRTRARAPHKHLCVILIDAAVVAYVLC
jgi:hypothetical protein